MIPEYLKGKSAVQILEDMENRIYSSNSTSPFSDSNEKMRMLLIIAVKDALMNADATGKLHKDRAEQAEGLAIAFLNEVLPYEE